MQSVSMRPSIWLCVLAAAGVVFIAISFWQSKYGPLGRDAVILSASVCYTSGFLSILLYAWIRHRVLFPVSWMIATAVRTFPPLVTVVILLATDSTLIDAGVFAGFALFYLLTLVVETLLSVGPLRIVDDDGSHPSGQRPNSD